MKKIILGAALASALCLPAVSMAQDDHSHPAAAKKTYYDAAHKDRHEWNSDEDSAWSQYRDDHHIKQTDFAKVNKHQQQDYWNWRHEHSDQH